MSSVKQFSKATKGLSAIAARRPAGKAGRAAASRPTFDALVADAERLADELNLDGITDPAAVRAAFARLDADLDAIGRPRNAVVRSTVLLFPPDAYALGKLSYNVATDAWWAPSLPWQSSFTGETCQQLASDFESATNGQWNSNISNYSLFEAAHAALTSVSDPHDKTEVAAAIHKVNLPQAVAGPLNFASGGPAPGVAITPPVGIQWQKGTKFPVEAQVVDNTLQPQAKITADLQPTNQ